MSSGPGFAVGPTMRKPTKLALTAVAALGLTVPTSSAAAADFNSCGYHPTTTVMLRTGPSAKQTAIGQLSPDDWVSASKASGAWYRVSLRDDTPSGLRAGTEGWVAKKYLKPDVCMQLN